MIQAINSTNNLNFNGRFLNKTAQVLKNQGEHIIVQSALPISCIFRPIEGAEDLITRKLLVDSLEIFSNIFKSTPKGLTEYNLFPVGKPATVRSQATNIFSMIASGWRVLIGKRLYKAPIRIVEEKY